MKIKPYVLHDRGQEEHGYEFWCLGCNEVHRFRTKAARPTREDGSATPLWHFDGNVEAPTFTPSLWYHHSRGHWEGKKWVPGPNRITDCHLYLRQGNVQWLSDCPHDLANQTRPLPEFPSSREQRDLLRMRKALVVGTITIELVDARRLKHGNAS